MGKASPISAGSRHGVPRVTPSKRLGGACLVLLSVLATTIIVPSTSSSAGAAGANWRVSASYPSSPLPKSVSCPSTSVCFAVGVDSDNGNAITVTTNGGATWTSQPVPASATGYTLSGISCSSTTECAVSGGGSASVGDMGFVLTTTDGGATWTSQSLPSSTGNLVGMACPSTTDCYALGEFPPGSSTVGTVVLASTDGGNTWASDPVTSSYGGRAITCPSISDCYVVGSQSGPFVSQTTDGGATWVSEVLPTGFSQLTGVSCNSITNCVAVGGGGANGQAIVETSDGGATWSLASAPAGIQTLSGVACPSTSDCYAVGDGDHSVILASTDGGVTWSQQTSPVSTSLSGIDCPTANNCTAIGNGATLGTTDSGATWTVEPGSFAVNRIRAISCPSASDCFAAGGPDNNEDVNGGGVIVATTDGGVSWISQTVPAGTATLDGISCASPTTCMAVGHQQGYSAGSVILSTTDGGKSWTDLILPPGLVQPSAVSCVTATTMCSVVAAGSIATTTDGGTTWISTAVLLYGSGGISCASVLNCIAVSGGDIFATSDGGAAWNTEGSISGISLSSVSCSTASDCFIVGGWDSATILSTTDGGIDWASKLAPQGTGFLSGISCATQTDCVAVGYGSSFTGATVIGTGNGGDTWTDQSVPAGLTGFNGISCPSYSNCTAVGWGSSGQDDGGWIISGANLFPLALSTTTLPYGRMNTPYSTSLSASGGTYPYTWSITSGGLPSGLNLDSTTGAITGTPPVPGSYPVSVTVTDSTTPALTAAAAFTLVILPPPVVITPATLPVGIIGQQYDQRLSASGGTPPYTWSILGTLPAGLHLNPLTGVIRGIPTTESYPNIFTAMATDSGSPDQTDTAPFSIPTVLPAPTITDFSPTSGPPGTLVKITGTHLAGATSVRFNSATAHILSDSSRLITVAVPAKARTGKFLVNTGGGSVKSAKSFTVT